jgi:hypothetical protein
MVEGNGKSMIASPPCRNRANSVHDAKVRSSTHPNLKEGRGGEGEIGWHICMMGG